MAISSTIFKCKLNIADIDRGYYADHALTIARHPSETNERMMVRLLAFSLFASDTLAFGKGISTDDEPALWDKDLTGTITHWIEVGLPDEKIIRRACGRADRVTLLLYGGKTADMWWQHNGETLAKQRKLEVRNISSHVSKALAQLADEVLDLQCTIQENEVWIANATTRLQIVTDVLQTTSSYS
jgi:uncharacterized protein YaeQ